MQSTANVFFLWCLSYLDEDKVCVVLIYSLQRGDCMANAFHSNRTEAQRRYEPLDIFRRNGVHKLSYFFNKGDLGLTIRTIIFANSDV